MPLRQRNRRLSTDLAIVVDKAMAPEREQRYQSIAELRDDLDNVLTHRPIRARRASAAVRLRRASQRHPAAALGLVVTGLLLTVGAVLFGIWQANALARFVAMRDVPLVEALVREAEAELWPIHPRRLADFDDWLARADDALLRRDGHARDLESLRARALPAPTLSRLVGHTSARKTRLISSAQEKLSPSVAKHDVQRVRHVEAGREPSHRAPPRWPAGSDPRRAGASADRRRTRQQEPGISLPRHVAAARDASTQPATRRYGTRQW